MGSPSSPLRRLPVVACCDRCGREFSSLGGSGIDHYPPQGWAPEGGWSSWRGERDPRYPPPECGGRIVPLPFGGTRDDG